MMKSQKLILICCIVPLLTIAPIVQFSYEIYYQSGDTIYAVDEFTRQERAVVSDLSQTVAFSNLGQYVAYYDSEGVWVSQIEFWSPTHVIANLPTETFSLFWSPDDTRLILRLGAVDQESIPTSQSVAYNLLTNSEENWLWHRCSAIAQHTISGQFALICERTTVDETVQKIALSLGNGEIKSEIDAYNILIEDIVDVFPRPFDWGRNGSSDNLVYTSYDDERYFVSLWNNKQPLEVRRPSVPEWMKQLRSQV